MLGIFSRRGKSSSATIVEEKASKANETQMHKICVLGVSDDGVKKGIFQDERIHMAVFGFPGTGKTRFLLSLALQNVKNGEGCMVIDPHGDLARLFLSHIPPERWGDVIYIDPTTALDYGRIVKINFLEYSDVRDRDIVARSFMDSLEKIYSRHWGPRLDMILMNAIYLLLDTGDRNLSNLYRIVADEMYREMLLAKTADRNVESFWRSEIKKMPSDASAAVLTKIYRLVQERIVAPMFDCDKSRVGFRKMMDENRIVVVNLSEGAITSDVANFLGSLILARVYLAGMSREDTPEGQRKPFYIYIDEAPRFVTASIKDILQSLRKYKVYMTLASQHLEQYTPEIAASIPNLCDSIICFSVGEDTAKKLEEFYKPSLTHDNLVKLPRYYFAVSAIVGGRRECEVLKTIDHGQGPYNIKEVVEVSLARWGDAVDMSKYTGVPAVIELPHPINDGVDPVSWLILLQLYWLYEEATKIGSGIYTAGKIPAIEQSDLVRVSKGKYNLTEAEVINALNNLSFRNWIQVRDRTYKFEVVNIPSEGKFSHTAYKCAVCEEITYRPFFLKGGTTMCHICLGRELRAGRVTLREVVDPYISEEKMRWDDVRVVNVKRRFYALSPQGLEKFFAQVPKGARGGGPEHTAIIATLARELWADGYFCYIDVGEETPYKVDDGAIRYETKQLPDIIAYPLNRVKGELDPRHWDNAHIFFIEVEVDPVKHRARVQSNLAKCRSFGRPVIFATNKPDWARGLVRILLESGEKILLDCTGWRGGRYDPTSTSVMFIDPKTATATSVTSSEQLLTAEEILAAKQEAKSMEPKTEVETQPLVQQEDLMALLLAFADGKRMPWHIIVKKANREQIVAAYKNVFGKMVVVKIGQLEALKPILDKFNIPYSYEEEALIKPEAPIEKDEGNRDWFHPPASRKEEVVEEAPAEPTHKAEEVVEQPTQRIEGEQAGEKKSRRQTLNLTEVEEKIIKLFINEGYKANVRTVRGRQYLRAVKGKHDIVNVAPLTDEVKSILKKHGVALSTPKTQMTDDSVEEVDSVNIDSA